MHFLTLILFILFFITNVSPLKAAFIKSEIEEDGRKRTITISFRENASSDMKHKNVFISDDFDFDNAEDEDGKFRIIAHDAIINTIKRITSSCFNSKKIKSIDFYFEDLIETSHFTCLKRSVKEIEKVENEDSYLLDKFLKIKIKTNVEYIGVGNILSKSPVSSTYLHSVLKNVEDFNKNQEQNLKTEIRKRDHVTLHPDEFRWKYYGDEDALAHEIKQRQNVQQRMEEFQESNGPTFGMEHLGYFN